MHISNSNSNSNSNDQSKAVRAQDLLRDSRLVYDETRVNIGIAYVASMLNNDFAHPPFVGTAPLVLVAMLGGMFFAGKLLPLLAFPLEVDYIHPQRYGEDTTGGDLKWKVEPNFGLYKRTVIVLDDVLDEGVTMSAITEMCHLRGASAVLSAVLVDKMHQDRGVHADYSGLITSEDGFLFGCGMDIQGFWRQLPMIRVYTGGK